MKKAVLLASTVAMLASPLIASAHEHASFLIGGKQYDIVIGSLNEPIVVDDKTGLDLRVTSGGHMTMSADGDMEPSGGAAATGLEQDLKVELIAGNKKMTQDISPAWGQPGSYKTTFYPTVATTFSYRLFGKINDTPVDITFTCLPEGQQATTQGEKEISAGVKQLTVGGGFGCPVEKSSLGFPESSGSVHALAAQQGSTRGIAVAGLALSVVALVFAGATRRRKHS